MAQILRSFLKSISKSGSAKIKGDATLSEGSGITLTQSGNDIQIASSGGATYVSYLVPSYALIRTTGASTLAYSSNTTAYGGLYHLSLGVVVTKIKLQTSAETVAGTFNLAVFSENGQTRLLNTTFTTNGSVTYTITGLNVSLAPGNYWIFCQPTGTANCTFHTLSYSGGAGSMASGGLAGPALIGRLSGLTAGTMPSTFSVASVGAFSNNDGLQIRLEA